MNIILNELRNINRYSLVLFCLMACTFLGCNKDFLDKKPDQKLLVPSTLTDFQSLLDNTEVMNMSPTLAGNATDDFYTTNAGLLAYGLVEGNCYTWAADLLQGQNNPDWTRAYQAIFYTNIVLDGLKKLTLNHIDSQESDKIKASALFFRAFYIYQLAQIFAKAYDPISADTDPGIPIPLNSDVNNRPGRGTVEQTYAQIIADLMIAADLLPGQVAFKTQPSKSAAFALLARIYLFMGRYSQSEVMATKALDLNDKLLDYNNLTFTLARPIPNPMTMVNNEVIFYSTSYLYTYELSALTYVDTVLYRSYANGDLRKQVFYRVVSNDIVGFKGNYTGTSRIFNGLSNDEIFLTRSECRARRGDVEGALEDLNILLKNRWSSNLWNPFVSSDPTTTLRLVLAERRKELISRGIRWSDLRRLNKDPHFARTLIRKINNKIYTLEPNDIRYTFPIPDNEIMLNSIEQNTRE